LCTFPKIDWKGVLASFAAPLFSRAGARPQQNITDFTPPPPGDDQR
jgi:hypothetical protein